MRVEIGGQTYSERQISTDLGDEASLSAVRLIRLATADLQDKMMVDLLLSLPNKDQPEGEVVRALGRILAPVLGTPVQFGWQGGTFYIRFGTNVYSGASEQEALNSALEAWKAAS
jgi:hypothetical protein